MCTTRLSIEIFINAFNHPQSAIHCFGFVSARHSEGPRPSESREVNTSWHFTCTKLQTGWSFCNDLCCFIIKSSPRFRCTLAWNPAFSVAPPVESPRYGGPSLWRTTIICCLLTAIMHRACQKPQNNIAPPCQHLRYVWKYWYLVRRYDTIRYDANRCFHVSTHHQAAATLSRSCTLLNVTRIASEPL